jgi:hypothetical protein
MFAWVPPGVFAGRIQVAAILAELAGNETGWELYRHGLVNAV